MQNVNAMGTNHGVRHAYAYGHAKKDAAANFKDAIVAAEDKSIVATDFKNIIATTEVKPETSPILEE